MDLSIPYLISRRSRESAGLDNGFLVSCTDDIDEIEITHEKGPLRTLRLSLEI